MARTTSQKKRPRKLSSETNASYVDRSRRKSSNTPFTIRTRTRAKISDVAVEVTSTPDSIQQSVEVNTDFNRPDLPPSLSTIDDSSSDNDGGILDSFQWNADEQSETTFVQRLQDINYRISDAVVPVLCALKGRMSYYKRTTFDTSEHSTTKSLDLRVAKPLVQALYAARQAQSKFLFGDEVIEALLQDTICTTLHQNFFDGKIFFGIRHSPDHKSALDTMFESLLERETWTVAQRWRSLASSAPTLKSQAVTDELASVHIQMENQIREAFNIVYPTSSVRFPRFVTKLVEMLRRPLEEIVIKAHSLSIALQTEMVTSRLQVILSLPQRNATQAVHEQRVLGTVSMGLRAVRPGPNKRLNSRILLLPTATNASLFSVTK